MYHLSKKLCDCISGDKFCLFSCLISTTFPAREKQEGLKKQKRKPTTNLSLLTSKSFLTDFFHVQVVAVFGSMHMGASRIMNLQRHRIAQCRSVVIRILGDEGVPVQVDGEAWLHPPGIIRILHKNRVQLVCRDKVRIWNIICLNRSWAKRGEITFLQLQLDGTTCFQ